MNLNERDVIVVELMSNTTYMGMNNDGLPIPATKAAVDGKYHLEGDFQAAPSAVFKNLVKEVAEMIDVAGEARFILFSPLPRYVNTPCCGNSTHVSNRGSDKFVSEQIFAICRFAEAIATESVAERV